MEARLERRTREGGAENTQWGTLYRFKEPCWAPGTCKGPEHGMELREQRTGWQKTTSTPFLIQAIPHPNHPQCSGFFPLMTIFPKYLMTSSQKQETMERKWILRQPTNCDKVILALPHKSQAKACFTVGAGGAGQGEVTMMTNIRHFTGNQHIDSVGPQSLTLPREKPIPTLQGLSFIENSSQFDPLLIRGKTGRDQVPLLKATGMLLRPQKIQGSQEPHFL